MKSSFKKVKFILINRAKCLYLYLFSNINQITMKFFFVFIFFLNGFVQTYSQDDTQLEVKILQAVFKFSKLTEYEGEKILETKARGKFATIPINNGKYSLLKFQNNIVALVFNIYLSENESHYKKMRMAGLYNFMDLEKDSELQALTNNERLIQLIFFDTKKNKFLAKADGFPIEGLAWLPTGMGDLTQIIAISELKPINKAKYSCYLKLTECPDCNNSTYCFKYLNDKVLSSKKFNGCYESFVESGKKIMGKEITNCYEYNYDNEPPKYEIVTLLKW